MKDRSSCHAPTPSANEGIVDRRVQKTYWHLLGPRRMPSDDELVAARLRHRAAKGFGVDMPAVAWRARFGAGLTLAADDWEAFSDPRETTYASYVAKRARQEALVSGLFERMEASGHDARLGAEAAALLEAFVFPLRYPMHALQMVSAYVGHLAPSSKIAIAAAFQAADETRRVQQIAYRLALRGRATGSADALDAGARRAWQDASAWQPLRRAIERLMVTYDWGEAFFALQVCLKPAFDAWAMETLPARAERTGDRYLGDLFFSLGEDCAWHRAWSAALVDLCLRQRDANRALSASWRATWEPIVAEAMRALHEEGS